MQSYQHHESITSFFLIQFIFATLVAIIVFNSDPQMLSSNPEILKTNLHLDFPDPNSWSATPQENSNQQPSSSVQLPQDESNNTNIKLNNSQNPDKIDNNSTITNHPETSYANATEKENQGSILSKEGKNLTNHSNSFSEEEKNTEGPLQHQKFVESVIYDPRNTTDESIKVIFKSTNHGTKLCHQNRRSFEFLCKINIFKHCKGYQISELLDTFWIICPIYSANHGKTVQLDNLHKNFRSYIQSYGINFQTVEVIFPGQKYQLTQPNNQPHDIQYESEWIFAMRENLVNVGIKHLPDNWEYFAWVDQHIYWDDLYWFEKSIELMNRFNIVQLLNRSEFLNVTNSSYWYMDGVVKLAEIHKSGYWRFLAQCGIAWGMKRTVFEKLGGLLDICIGGKCDTYQSFAVLGSIWTNYTENSDYANAIATWQDHAIKVYNGKVGCLDSKVYHFQHCFDECWTSDTETQVYTLIQYRYNPKYNLERDKEGRLSLVNNLPLAIGLWEFYGGDPR